MIVCEDDSKHVIRKKVWDYMENNKIAAFPFPPHNRIPNYKTAEKTATKLMELEYFNNAKTVKIDPDKPLQQIRYNSLQKNKILYVPTPRLASSFLNKITPFQTSKQNWFASSKKGITQSGVAIDLSDNHHIDLCIVGAVAVSCDGWRIGKGKGFTDLEYAIMCQSHMLNPASTKVVACVHDCQVFDALPRSLFKEHDVPVDVIVTPTRIITCAQAAGEGFADKSHRDWMVHWNLLTPDKISSIPILQRLSTQKL